MSATPLRPGGFVIVDGVRHPARCPGRFVDQGTEVVVVDGDNLGLVVREWQSDDPAPARHGESVFSSFGTKVKTLGQQSSHERERNRQRVVSNCWKFGAGCGLACSLIACSQMWRFWEPLAEQRYSVAGLLIVAGVVWGALVARTLFGAFEQIEHELKPRLTYFATVWTLAGTTGALIYVLPARGTIVGLATVLCTTAILGSALLGLAVVGEWVSGNQSEGSISDSTGKTNP